MRTPTISTGCRATRPSSRPRAAPDNGTDLCSQPTVSRWENAPSLRDPIRVMRVTVDLFCASYPALPAAVRTPSGTEVRRHLHRLVHRIRKH
jgi:hypothetical protein